MTTMQITIPVSSTDAPEIGRRLLEWYDQSKRDLPWRRTRDPYAIWVSEIMLQQTRVETVIPYWTNFMESFPTIQTLADAPEEDVLKRWEGLGYYSRVRNLQQAAREVQEQYGGKVPHEMEEMLSLPGVGSYTAGAVLSIAYDKDVPAVDGNVLRVLSRLFAVREDVGKQSVRKEFERVAQVLIPAGKARFFNQALMEFGATVCIPKSPRCLQCPLQSVCRAYEVNIQSELPQKAKKKPPRPMQMATAILWKGHRVLLDKRPETGLLAGLWEFPTTEVREGQSARESVLQYVKEKWGVHADLGEMFAQLGHTFSHIHWEIQAFQGEVTDAGPFSESRWVTIDEAETFTLPVVHQKLLQTLRGIV